MASKLKKIDRVKINELETEWGIKLYIEDGRVIGFRHGFANSCYTCFVRSYGLDELEEFRGLAIASLGRHRNNQFGRGYRHAA